MYSCAIAKREDIVQMKTVSWKGFDSVQKCRFDQRYDDLHQKQGCDCCLRDWDVEYLKQQGLLK